MLELDDRKSRHDEGTVDNFRIHDVGDPTVDNDARVEYQRFHALDVTLEFNVRNDEPKIIARL